MVTTSTRGNHVCLPLVGGQKRKPQIDGTYKVKNLHIQGEDNLSYYLTHYHQIEITSQHILITDHFNLHVYGVANTNQFLCICNQLHLDLSPISIRFVTMYMQICCHLHVYLSLVSLKVVMIFLWICYNLCVSFSLLSFLFVPTFIWICEEMQMYMIHIGQNIHVFLSKAAHEHKLV